MSTDQYSTQPIAIASPSNDSHPSSSQSPSSALSASLKAFSDLSLANRPPVKLESDEFKQAYHHARRASFGNNSSASATRPIIINDEPRQVPGLSTSPGSNVSDLSSLPTPSSSPPSTSAISTSTSSSLPTSSSLKRSASNGGNGNGKTAAVPILGGVCEKEEIEALESGELLLDEPASAPAHHHSRSFSNTEGSTLFGGGARWGWPGGGGNGSNSPPQQQSTLPLRRASLAFTSPPGSSTIPLPANSVSTVKHSPPLPPTQTDPFARMQPLGRVVSAGASLQTPHDGSGAGEGLGGLFRRFSIGGFGNKRRPQPPSPPSLALPARESTLTAPESTPRPSAQDDARSRGRTLGSPGSAGATKPKRKLSPMGEKFLRGGY